MRDVFKKGHYYKFTSGDAFYVKSICDCYKCKERGLYEPKVMWLSDCNEGWRADYISSPTYYDGLAKTIEIESDHREPWVDECIKNTIEEKRKELEKDIQEYLESWK
jgi:hypothetical protein